jgi:plastocyanin
MLIRFTRPITSFHWSSNMTGGCEFATRPSQLDLSNTPQWTPTGLSPSPSNTSSSKIHMVSVGGVGKFTFEPDQVNASIGDTIVFDFLALNHSLTQSSFSHPCVRTGFDTGFQQLNPSNETGKHIVKFPVLKSESQWFFCAQTNPFSHCEKGMVFSLNPYNNLSSFVSIATQISSNTSFVSTTLPSQSQAGSVLITSTSNVNSSTTPAISNTPGALSGSLLSQALRGARQSQVLLVLSFLWTVWAAFQ